MIPGGAEVVNEIIRRNLGGLNRCRIAPKGEASPDFKGHEGRSPMIESAAIRPKLAGQAVRPNLR